MSTQNKFAAAGCVVMGFLIAVLVIWYVTERVGTTKAIEADRLYRASPQYKIDQEAQQTAEREATARRAWEEEEKRAAAQKAADEESKEKLRYNKKCEELTRHLPLTGFKVTGSDRKAPYSNGLSECLFGIDFFATNITDREIDSCTCEMYLKGDYDVPASPSIFCTCRHIKPHQAIVCSATLATVDSILDAGNIKPAWRVTQIDFVPVK